MTPLRLKNNDLFSYRSAWQGNQPWQKNSTAIITAVIILFLLVPVPARWPDLPPNTAAVAAVMLMVTTAVIIMVSLYTKNKALKQQLHSALQAHEHSSYALADTRLQVSRLVKQQQYIKKQEQQKLAAELHDDLGGSLASLKIQLETIIMHCNEVHLKSRLQAAAGQAAELYNITRIKSHSLYNMAGEICIYDKINEIMLQMLPADRYKKDIIIDADILKTVTESIKNNILLITREAVLNIVKHAKADRVVLSIHKTQQGISIHIRDNGSGFSSAAKAKAAGIGFASIKGRVAAMKGDCCVLSDTTGTSIKICIPCSPGTAG